MDEPIWCLFILSSIFWKVGFFMRFKYNSLLLISILIIILGMNFASAADAYSDSSLNNIGIDDSIEGSSVEVSADDSRNELPSSVDSLIGSYSSSDFGLDQSNTENKESSSEKSIENEGSDFNSKMDVLMESPVSNANLTYYVSCDNYTHYFDDSGVLKDEFGGSILVFEGNFEDKGVFVIDKNDTRLVANGSRFVNTVFSLTASGVVLANFNFDLDQAFPLNHNAGIYVGWDNITVFNNTVSYLVPADTTCIGIYADDNIGLNLINNTVNYYGQAFNDGFNYAVLLTNCYDAFVSGNHVNATLPLREVNWGQSIYGGVSMDKVSAFAAGECDNLLFVNNSVYSTINYGVYASNRYPTLSSVLIYACDNSTIDSNNITVEDFYTRKGQANYLYALDIYHLNDISIVNNVIDLFSYGGTYYQGTAYPIQINGPAYNIKVAYNYLHSVNNGPNIGIYSQNYYGNTQIDIISNFINVTGKASNHMWGLVAGIEVQDSDDRILNNTIIVDTVGGYKDGDRIYGISYSQNTQGNHKYEIKYNNVTVPGPVAISLNQGLGSTTSDTNVMYNILVTGRGAGGDSAVMIGGKGTNNVVRYNTNGSNPVRHMSERDLPDWLKDYHSPKGRGIGLHWMDSDSSEYNSGFAGNGSNGRGNSLNGNGNGNGFNFDSDVNGRNSRFSRSNATHGDLNSTHYTVGDSGVSLAAASASAGSGDSSSAASDDRNAYEIDEHDNVVSKSSDYLQLGLICIVALLLLLVGYKRQKDKEEEE